MVPDTCPHNTDENAPSGAAPIPATAGGCDGAPHVPMRTARRKIRPEWTPAEDDALRAAWTAGGIEAARAALPQRSAFAICYRARRLLGPVRRRKWTERDVAKLRAMWDACYTLTWLARKLGRSEKAVYEKAQALGLPLGCPQGYEYASNAAVRTGCTRRQFKRALAQYQESVPSWERAARTQRPLSLSRRARRRNVLVEPDVADAAVAAWTREG